VCDVPPAEGAMYCFPKIATTMDAMTLAERLIREHKVAVTPGSAFGMSDGCYFRVAFGALQRETVAEGIGRLVTGLRAICGCRDPAGAAGASNQTSSSSASLARSMMNLKRADASLPISSLMIRSVTI
jgi:hypothetical protein